MDNSKNQDALFNDTAGLDLERYKDRIESYKKVGNQIHIDRMQGNIEDGFLKSPSYFNVEVNGVSQDVHIVEGLEGNNFLLTRPSEDIKVGDLVDWQGSYHLCIEVRNNKVIQTKAELQRCNETLTWRDDEGKIWGVPCILLDKTSVYSDGISKKKYISIGTDQISITTQSNAQVDKIPIDKRLIFANDINNIYKVNRKDNILNKGVTLFVAKKDLYNRAIDDLEAGIAGEEIKRPEREPLPPEDTVPSDDGELKINGRTRLSIWDEDVEYSIDPDLDVEWTIEPKKILDITKRENNACFLNPFSTSVIGDVVLTAKVIVDGEPKFTSKKIKLLYE